MLGAEGGAAGRDGGPDAREVGGHHVGVALDDHHLMLGGDLLAGDVQAVEHVGLVVDRGLGCVEVLGALVGLQQFPGAEADGVAGDVADRPHQAAAEAVVDTALPFGHQPAGDEFRLGEAARAQHSGERVPAFGGEAHPEGGGGILVEATFGEEPATHLRRRCGELFAEVLLGDGVRIQKSAPGAEVGSVGAAAAAVLVVQLDAIATGQHLDRLDEAEVADLLHEGDHVPALAAAEAVPMAQLRADVERGGLLVVERAQALHRADPAGAQRDVLGDDFVQAGAFPHQLHVGATDQSLGHPLRAPIRGRAAGYPPR